MNKGALFLYYLEEVVGGSSKMVQFLKYYLKKYAFKPVTTEQFKSTFISFFKKTKGINQIDWNRWLHKPADLPYKVRQKHF